MDFFMQFSRATLGAKVNLLDQASTGFFLAYPPIRSVAKQIVAAESRQA
jgi:hypothetical protein